MGRRSFRVRAATCVPLVSRKVARRVRGAHYIDIHVVEHCNLNCRGCAHFSCIAQPHMLSVAEFKHSLDALAPVFAPSFNSIHLLGGEPLLHPELPTLMRLARDRFPAVNLQLVTNGLLLPRMDEGFWDVCRATGTRVYVSEYPAGIDYDAIRVLLGQRGVSFEMEGRTAFTHHVYDLAGTQPPRRSYAACPFGGVCLQLVGTRLYPCARSAYIDHFNQAFGFSFEHATGDWLDLADLTPARLWRFLHTPKPFCQYCDIAAEWEIPWGRTQRKAQEWLVSDAHVPQPDEAAL